MENLVQKININDIIPNDFQPTLEEKNKIDEQVQFVKNFGLLEPILVRPKNDKYEIVIGIDRYQAAVIAGQKIVPVIIEQNEKETHQEYININNEQSNSITSIPIETFFKSDDIVNLSELSKIKLEDERDDVIMNNGQLNNMQNNTVGQTDINQTNQVPAFGGRFFPSLEDEPTNMNMMGGINGQPNIPVTQNMNNNLIDLTDLSLEKEPIPTPTFNVGETSINMPPLNEIPLNNFETPNLGNNSSVPNDNIINLESLQKNNPNAQPIPEPVSMDILNADFGFPQPIPTPINVAPNLGINVPTASETQNSMPLNFGLNQPPVAPINNQMASQQSMPNLDININPSLQGDFVPVPDVVEKPVTSVTVKDVTPVTNTIKNLVTSLTSFGFKINITEENLPNIAKIVIEVEK